ncbi:MAG: M48 family metallopeptidase [Alphaproteobacteria bacterium]|nr:M48 family metallopeptidase [Alphaproteobacteria bacterium]
MARRAALKATETLDLGAGVAVPVVLRRMRRARRITLTLDPKAGHLRVAIPARASAEAALAFVRGKRDWVRKRVDLLPARVPFADGARIPLFGADILVRHRPDLRGVVHHQENELRVAGQAAFLARRLAAWLKEAARKDFTTRALALAARIERPLRAVTLRDTTSRWGSCSPDGRLSFCWRLVFAPVWVIDYVVAHEVAHLVHPHHGPRFWALVRALHGDPAPARVWLRREGTRLLRYG